MTTKLYLIRHGKTAANLEDRFAGRSPEPLHPEGIEQIRTLGARLHDHEIAHIYCGPLPRVMQSAAILQETTGAAITPLVELTEIAIPHWDKLTKDDIRQRFGAEYPTWLNSPADFRLAGCETIGDVQQRAARAVETILASHQGQNILLVSHLIVLRALHLHYLALPLGDFRKVKLDNGSVTCLTRAGNSSEIATIDM